MRNNKLLIFQIGFNKCGTRSLYHFFKDNGIPSIHYDGGKIAKSMFQNNSMNKKFMDKKWESEKY